MLKRPIPTGRDLVPHQTVGYSFEQSYVRAFNEANRLKHTPFESQPKHKAKR